MVVSADIDGKWFGVLAGEMWEAVAQDLKSCSFSVFVRNIDVLLVTILQEGTSKFATLEINPKRAQRRHQQQRDLVSQQT